MVNSVRTEKSTARIVKQSKQWQFQSTRQADKEAAEAFSVTEFTNLSARYKRAAYEKFYPAYYPSELQKLLTFS